MSIFFNQLSRGIMPAIRRTTKTVQKPIVRISSGRSARHPVDFVNLPDGLINKLSRPNSISSNERRILKAHTDYHFPKDYIEKNADYFKDLERRDNLTFAQHYDVMLYQMSKQGGALKQQARQTARKFKSDVRGMAINTRNLWRTLQTPQARRPLLIRTLLGRMPHTSARPPLPAVKQKQIPLKLTGAPPFWPAGPQKRPVGNLPWTLQEMPDAKRVRTQPPPPTSPSASVATPLSPFHTQDGKKAVTSGATSSVTNPTPKRPLENDAPFNLKRQRTTADPLPFTLPARLEDVTFQQRNGYSCYVLAAFDSLLHHPEGRKVLDRIRIEKLKNGGYNVKFPAQPNAIHVTQADRSHPETVKASHEFVPIVEQASLKIPGVARGEYDNVHRAMARIFGESPTGNLDVRTLEESLRQSEKPGGPVKIWTAMKIHGEGSNKAPGEHYYSVRLSNSKPGHVTVSNPFNSGKPETMPLSEFQKTFVAESVEIPAG